MGERKIEAYHKEGCTFSASVKVMRSYDYCHFEIALSSDNMENLIGVDELRKE
jgi:hypothetical protein